MNESVQSRAPDHFASRLRWYGVLLWGSVGLVFIVGAVVTFAAPSQHGQSVPAALAFVIGAAMTVLSWRSLRSGILVDDVEIHFRNVLCDRCVRLSELTHVGWTSVIVPHGALTCVAAFNGDDEVARGPWSSIWDASDAKAKSVSSAYLETINAALAVRTATKR